MKQAVLGYDQKFFINGTQVSGVQSVNGSYAINETPINVLGWGHVNQTFGQHPSGFMEAEGSSFILSEAGFYMVDEGVCSSPDSKFASLAVLSAPLEGSFNVNSTLVSEDFMLGFTGDTPFTGSVHHGDKYFGFYSGYITSHSVTCQVGAIPTTSTSIKVFGDIGGVFENTPGSPNYNASGTNPFPTIKIPNQGSISVECTGASTDRVVSFNHMINIPVAPIYTVGSSVAAQVDVVWPISTETNFTLDIDEYNYQHLRKYLASPTVQDIAINIKDCFGSEIQKYTVKNARLIGESMSASAEGRLTVDLQYQAYYNKR